MISWNVFIWFAVPAVALAVGASVVSLCANDHWSASSVTYRRRRGLALGLAAGSLAVLSAFIIGLCEEIIKGLGYTTFSDAFTFALLIVVLCVKPTGLFGEKVTDKV